MRKRFLDLENLFLLILRFRVDVARVLYSAVGACTGGIGVFDSLAGLGVLLLLLHLLRSEVHLQTEITVWVC